MEKSLFKKELSEVSKSELLAYTISKIKPYEWVKIKSFNEDDIYKRPASFWFRFHKASASDYFKLRDCIKSFNGNLTWVIYEAPLSSKKNLGIEPLTLYRVKQRIRDEEKPFNKNIYRDLLGDSDYQALCENAVNDITDLCAFISQTFNLKDIKPYEPILDNPLKESVWEVKNHSQGQM